MAGASLSQDFLRPRLQTAATGVITLGEMGSTPWRLPNLLDLMLDINLATIYFVTQNVTIFHVSFRGW